jgi:sucrose-6-phosphate hydrolase SacC (GH32 family)
MHTAHNNDANGPFYFNGMYHIFMQQSFPWVKGWNGGIGWGHLASHDLAHWKEISE